MTVYYNEHDPYAAQWLRNLIKAGHIAPGVVDERSIEDVKPDELMGYTQCHFFAGIGVWSLALRSAGWPDNRPVWTGSCPCQPFSAAGAGAGFADARHLWPSFAWLIKQCSPPVVIGEQVASKAVEPWVDLVQADLEALGYAFGAVPFPAAGVGAPHIRDRLYWVADTDSSAGAQGSANLRRRTTGGDEKSWPGLSGGGMPNGLAYAGRKGLQERERVDGISGAAACPDSGQAAERGGICAAERMANADGGLQQRGIGVGGLAQNPTERPQGTKEIAGYSGDRRPVPTNGFWRAADWLSCRDDRWRPVEPGTCPLVARPAGDVGSVRAWGRNRTGRLKGYGNAINAEAAAHFLAAYLESRAGNLA